MVKNKERIIKHRLKLKAKFRRQFSYKLRLTISLLVFVLLFSLCLYYASKSFDFQDSKIVNYQENNKVNYQVYVKPNNFYETDYLDENMIYVASLIDKIKINFDYLFKIDEKNTFDFTSKVIGNLVIANLSGNTKYFEKEYVISDSETNQMVNEKNYNLNKEVEIDYDYYNQLANNFKTSYGLETNSYLEVSLQVNKKNDLNIDDVSTSKVIIPLSEKSIEIKFDSQDSVLMKKTASKEKIIFNSDAFVKEITLFILSICLIWQIIKLLGLLVKKKNTYDVYLNKILKEYDRLIVETTTGINFKDNSIIKLDKFNELLDVRDNLKLPIMYYNVVKHQKCYFYIKNGTDIYMMKLKASDMENT